MNENNDPICLVFIPALVAVLLRAEKDKELPLSEVEVTEIRDNATCKKVKLSEAIKINEDRGYEDIVAEEAWEEWKQARLELYPEKNYET